MVYETLAQKLAVVEGGSQLYDAFVGRAIAYRDSVVDFQIRRDFSLIPDELARKVESNIEALKVVVGKINEAFSGSPHKFSLLPTSDQELGDLVVNELNPRAKPHSQP